MEQKRTIGFFDKYLSVWVALCIIAGIATGYFAGDGIEKISNLEIAGVNIPVAILNTDIHKLYGKIEDN